MKPRKRRYFGWGDAKRLLPKQFRFETNAVLVYREGQEVIVEPTHDWPDKYVESFAGVPDDFTRPAQGVVVEKRTQLR